MTDNVMGTLYSFLEADDKRFDFEAATEFYIDVRVEHAMEIEFVKQLGKLETKIKNHIKATGEVGAVAAKITVNKNRKKANIDGLEQIAGSLAVKYPDVEPWILEAIKTNILANITEYEVSPSVKLSLPL